MAKMVTLTIDDKKIEAPAGMVIVDAAQRAGIPIPIFCYHPKMEPAGMCRMCLVEVGRPIIDRTTNQPVMGEDGQAKINFGPKMETACTTPVTEGMVVHTKNDAVQRAQKDILEFLLTSHPLDCPVCDKGGECPLQNLTMRWGPHVSRFHLEDKHHGAKHLPLGDLIYLDRERCIQCGRCVRFQHELAGDPVIDWYLRGRDIEISTSSEPGFDSIWSGNTTDICPVGALTTADFRFGARPWELWTGASICPHCPVGCNLSVNVRREASSGGKVMIKRVMPRQNEKVNEIWICDKGRFGYHFMDRTDRLTQPQARKDGKLMPVSWDEALANVSLKLKDAKNLVTFVGGRLSNEDLYAMAEITDSVGGKKVLNSWLAGGEIVQQYGLSADSNLGDLGKGDVILVVASDLHQEAPIWWFRIKGAVKRGARLIVLNPRETRLDELGTVIRTTYDRALESLNWFLPGAEVPEPFKETVEAFAAANNTVIFYGSEGTDLESSQAIAQTAAVILSAKGKVGQTNNGLVAVWPEANTQGAWDMRYKPDANLMETFAAADVIWVADADPLADDPALYEVLKDKTIITQGLFLTETDELAEVVLPTQAIGEREGTYTNGELRTQRFFPLIQPPGSAKPDYLISAELGEILGVELPKLANLMFDELAMHTPSYHGLSYMGISQVEDQWPDIARSHLYYGGTSYENRQGMGKKVELLPAQPVETPKLPSRHIPSNDQSERDRLVLAGTTHLYPCSESMKASEMLTSRLCGMNVSVAPVTAEIFSLADGGDAILTVRGSDFRVTVRVDASVPTGVVLAPRGGGIPILEWAEVKLRPYAQTEGEVRS